VGDWLDNIELTQTAWLFALAVLPVLAWYHRRSLVDFPAAQRRVSLAVRAVIVVLLVLALAGLTLLRPVHDLFVVFVLDESLSLGDDARTAREKFVAEAVAGQGSHKGAFLEFARTPNALRTERAAEPPKTSDVPEPESAEQRNARRGTNIAAAIDAAVAGIPPGYVPRVVLVSDGNQTEGDAVRVALGAGVRVDTVALPTRTEPEVQVSAVDVPAQVRQGEPFHVDVTIDTNHDDEGTIEVFRGAHKVASEKKPLNKGENRFRFQQSITDERLVSYSVRISGLKSDTLVDNNADTGLVYTSGQPRVLVVDRDPDLAQHLAYAMEQEEIQVEVRPPQGAPDSLSDLQNYELLILSNVAATELSHRQMDLYRTYVQDLGGGLMMLGGDQSFGLGGYYKTVIEEILPVRSDFEKEKEKPSLAMVLVVDKSGSMGGDKMEMAKEAAKAAVELLGPSDKVGVIAFEGEFYWVADLQPASNKGAIIDAISRVEAGGGTVMYPPMEEAFNVLQATSAKLKHVIMLTDGVSAPGDFEGMAASMAAARITCSTVGVGGDCDETLLQAIAELGNGRYYLAEDPNSVPQIFAKETMTASKSAINEQPFTPQVIRPTQALAEIDWSSAPFLLGYVVTRPKPTCEFILATESGDPLLAWWRYGLGMTVAFTSDAKSRWAAEWLAWPGYGRFWAQVIRQTMRKNDARGLTVKVDKSDGRVDLTLDSIDPAGRFLNAAASELMVIDSRLGRSKIKLEQTAPGRYQGSFPTTDAGAYHLELTQKVENTLVAQQSRGLAVGYPAELRLRSTNETLLKEIATASRGRYQPSPRNVFADLGETARRPIPLWPWLLSVALTLFVLDVALRRIDFSVLWPGRRG
jgi:Ca-activated chloride channel homolog